ncbi:MAG: VCBS repeat-containing protein [candidate division Zixibacteria bacterium]|nr:VCBS repeat-containing protein [candidate division Zixibacteria bacterium]
MRILSVFLWLLLSIMTTSALFAVGHSSVETCDTLLHEGDFSMPLGTRLRQISFSDFDKNGLIDIGIASEFSNQVIVLLNLDGLTFAAPRFIGVQDHPMGIAAVDVDNDGDDDLVATNTNSNSINIVRNDGMANFAVVQTYGTGNFPGTLTLGDFDRDSLVDIAVLNGFGQSVSIFKNLGDATFQGRPEIPIGFRPWSIQAADIDMDLDTDLIITCGDLGIQQLLNDGSGSFTLGTPINVPQGAGGLAIADIDGDSDPDVLVSSGLDGGTLLTYANDLGQLTEIDNYPIGDGVGCICATDLDEDNDLDLVMSHDGSGTYQATVLINDGTGSFCLNFEIPNLIERTVGAYSADIDNDSDNDVIMVHWGWDFSGLTFLVNSLDWIRGDADGDGSIAISDAVYLVNYIFAGGPVPAPITSGDPDCSGAISISDGIYLINYIFGGGPAPCEP